MKIAVDAMGGDIGPGVSVTAAVNAAREFGLSIILVGQEDILSEELSRHRTAGLDLVIKDASQIVSMHDHPSMAVRQKKDSSIRVAAELVKSGDADGMVSAGNTGVVMATAKIFFKALEGVDRPAIATVLPTLKGACLLLDAGANVDCKPRHLLQFAIMGHAYAQQVLCIPKPRVGVLSNGSEDSKGNDLSRTSLGLIRQVPFECIGNVEGRDIFRGEVDVVVPDGFIGNVALKVAEGVEALITTSLRKEVKQSILARMGFLLMFPVFKRFKKRFDYAEYGGAPLLGLNKVCIICHGISNARAIKNAIRVASEYVGKNVNSLIIHDIMAVKQLIENKALTLGEAH